MGIQCRLLPLIKSLSLKMNCVSASRMLLTLFIISISVNLTKAEPASDRQWNICSSAEDFCRQRCTSLSPTASCSGACGLFQIKTWTCRQLVGETGGQVGHTPLQGYTNIPEQSY